MDRADQGDRIVRLSQKNSELQAYINNEAGLRLDAELAVEEELLSKKKENLAKKVELETAVIQKLKEQNLYVSESQFQQEMANIDAELAAKLDALAKEEQDAKRIGDEQRLAKIKQRQEDAKNQAAEDKRAKQASKKASDDAVKAAVDTEEKKQKKLARYKKRDEENKAVKDALSLTSGQSLTERFKALKAAATDENGKVGGVAGLTKLAGTLVSAIGDFAKQLDNQIENIARKQSSINTRLQGSDKTWQDINKKFNKTAGASPLIKQEDLVTNLESMVEAGINYNVEQRAFLATISKKIATTFNAADSTMLKLIRLQQKDSTAARLGMESAMTAFLNNMYENTEYLKGVAESVRSQLAEAESLMTDKGAVEFEFQMQKWLGSLYSVGMSNTAVSNIAGAVGNLAAGNISGLTSGGVSNLMIMAANRSGISLTEALQQGLDASKTNKLMQAMVEYLAELYNNSKDSHVLQQQFANVYGVTASDLRAALNLANDNNKTLQAITNNNLTYNGAMGQLMNMASTMHQRTSMGEMLENAFGNLKYTMSSGIANSPALYATYKIAGMLDNLVGGIQLPFINTFFGGIDLHTSVADIMRTGALGGSILSGLGGIINSLSGGPSGWGTNMMKAMGIGSNVTAVKRGNGGGLSTSGVTVSESGYIGNASGGDVQSKSMANAEDQKQEAQAEDTSGDEMKTHVESIDNNVASLLKLFEAVKSGAASLQVRLDANSVWTQTGGLVNE